MSKRLQVLLEDVELAAIRKIARRNQMTTAEWVRQTLRRARRQEPTADTAKKLTVIRVAARYDFPTADIEQMLMEIEKGYVEGDTP